MSFDRHGQLHVGTISLFNEPDNLAAAEARQYHRRKEDFEIERHSANVMNAVNQ